MSEALYDFFNKVAENMNPENTQFQEKASRIMYYLSEYKSYDESKRLERYVNKCNDIVLNKYLKKACGIFFGKEKLYLKKDPSISYTPPACNTISDLIRYFFIMLFACFATKEDGQKLSDISGFGGEHSVVLTMVPQAKMHIRLLSQHAVSVIGTMLGSTEDRDREFFENIVCSAFSYACQNYLAKRRASADKVCSSNKFMWLPETEMDCAGIFAETVEIAYYEMLLYSTKSVYDSVNDYVKNENDRLVNEEILSLQDENKSLDHENELLKEKVRRLETENARLSNNVAMLKDANDDCSSMVVRRLAKLRKDYSLLEADLRKSISDAKSDSDEVVECNKTQPDIFQTIDVDMDKTYLFVCGESHPNKSQILEAFPNSMFYDGQNPTTLKYDMVVFLVSHLEHSTYYKMKQHCRSNKDTYVQCSATNIDGIKTAIWNVINS